MPEIALLVWWTVICQTALWLWILHRYGASAADARAREAHQRLMLRNRLGVWLRSAAGRGPRNSDLDSESEVNLIARYAGNAPVLAWRFEHDHSDAGGWNASSLEPLGDLVVEPLFGLEGPPGEERDLYEDVGAIPGRWVDKLRWLLGHPDFRVVVGYLEGFHERPVDRVEDAVCLGGIKGPEDGDLREGHRPKVGGTRRLRCSGFQCRA
jgi:hypothetical protein